MVEHVLNKLLSKTVLVKMKTLLHICLTLLSIIITVSSQNCNLPPFSVKYYELNKSKQIVRTYNNCLNPGSFNNIKVSSLLMVNQSIPTIPAHFIENLVKLAELELNFCGIQSILPGAFRNLPKLGYMILKGNNFPRILRGTFDTIPNTQYLQLDSNEIVDIEDQSFHIPDMIWISVSGNPLTIWNQEWFGKLDKLEEIRFANNNITTIPRRAFSNFRNLITIGFQNNKIRDIQPEAFDTLNYISRLDLRGNQIALLNANSFPNPTRIDYFLVTLNHLNFIPQALLNKLTSKYISLDFNPWTCACQANLNQWAFLNNVTISRESCTPERLPICTAFRPTCTEEINPRGTQKFLQVFKNLTQDQNSCVHLYLKLY